MQFCIKILHFELINLKCFKIITHLKLRISYTRDFIIYNLF